MEDLNKEIETWEIVKPESNGVYLSDKQDSLNLDEYTDATRARFLYETNVQQMPKSDYVGMVRYFDENKKRNPFTTAFRAAWTGTLGLGHSLAGAGIGKYEEARYAFTNLYNDIIGGGSAENPISLQELVLQEAKGAERLKDVEESANALRQKNDAWIKQYGLEKDEKDYSLLYDLVQGGMSMLGAIGFSVATHNPSLAASLFGVIQYGETYNEMRENGLDVTRASNWSTIAGIGEGALEKVGLEAWFDNYMSKKIGGFLLKQGLTEFTQESLQQATEEFIMRKFGGRVDGKDFIGVAGNVLYAGLLGGMLGLVGGGVSIPSTQAYKGRAKKILEMGGMKKDEASKFVDDRAYGNEEEKKELEDKVVESLNKINKEQAVIDFKKIGMTADEAKEFAELMQTNPQEAKESLRDLMNKEADFETMQNNSLADDIEYIKKQRKEDMIKEAFDIKEKIKEEHIAAGVNEKDAEAFAIEEADFAFNMWERFGEKTPLEYYENDRARIHFLDEEGEIINEGELTEEELARLEAKEQARKAEEDIPFFQESLKLAEEERKAATPESTQDVANADAIVVFDDGTAMAYQPEAKNEAFYQSAFAGSRVDYDRPSLEAIGSGEGNQAHGWGLYYALNRDVAEGYREAFTNHNRGTVYFGNVRIPNIIDANLNGHAQHLAENGDFTKLKENIKELVKIFMDGNKWNQNRISEGQEIIKYIEQNEKLSITALQDFIKKNIESKWTWETVIKAARLDAKQAGVKADTTRVKKAIERHIAPFIKEETENRKAAEDLLASTDDDFSNITMKKEKGQVHEVDIPENPYLLDEQKTFAEQSDFVKEKMVDLMLNETLKETNASKEKRNEVAKAMEKWTGGHFYQHFAVDLKSDKAASQLLEKYGIKGITYDGRQDGRCFVIFNPADVKVIQKFYQGEKTKGKRKAKAMYIPAQRAIYLFKNADRTSFIHEFGHHFTMLYVDALERHNRQYELEGFYKWLGINDISEATHETWEKMARGFETYVMEGEAPNIDTESLFKRFKRYMIAIYTDFKGKVIPPEEINDDVREFFDIMIAGEETLPDVRGLKGKLEQIKGVISGALKGEEVNFEGLTIKDLKELEKLLTMRKPRKPQNLKQRIRAVGGIDIDFAKAIGIYDSKKGNEHGFFKEGGIDREDSLIDFLTEEGYIANTGTETYEETSAVMEQAIRLLENADNAYTAEEQRKLEARDEIEAAAWEAARTLGNINTDDIFKAIKVLQKYDIKPVDKNTLKYLNASIKQVEKLAKEAKKEIRQAEKDIANKQADLIDYVKKLPLSYKSQMKIIERLKRATLAKDFEKVIDEAAELGKEFYREEKRKMLAGMINDEIKSSRPKKVTQQRYDYTNNKLFKDLREYSKMTQEQAGEALSKMPVSEDTAADDLVRMHYLNYKANGAKSSQQLLEQTYIDIIIAKQEGERAKDDADFENAITREATRQEIIDAIDNNNADKNTFKTRAANAYRQGLSNLYSLINSITTKKLAKQFEMETVINDANIKFHNKMEALKPKAFKIYDVKSYGDFLNKVSDLGQIIDKLYNVDGVKVEELSKMKIIDIYNAMKNEKTRKDYIDNYGEEQLSRVLSYLNDADKAFGDLLMEDIDSLFPEVNQTYIRVYGMDLMKVDNYWPATSEHTDETSMLGDYYSQQTTPSSWKERTKGRVTPIPQNAWAKYLKHMNENIYMINTAEKYKALAQIFKSKRIRNKITNKFGAGVYNELMEQINSLSLNEKSKSDNYVEKTIGSLINNFVLAKIAVAPTVFAGQLMSVTNYSEDVNTVDFYKNFAKGLAHPKQTIEFMKKVAGGFLEARYKGGFAESVSNVLREAEDAVSKKYRLFSPKAKYNIAHALSSFVRTGDIGAIIFGGYGQIQTLLDSGMKLEDAVKKFEFDTLRSQQSSVRSSLSRFQKETRGLSRMLLAFKNTPIQYFRKIADAAINLQRGEISKQQATKIIVNYALVQAVLYQVAKNATKMALGLGGDDDKLSSGVLEQILLGTIDAIPLVSDFLHYVYKQATGKYAGNLVNMVGVDDVMKSFRKFAKDEKDVYDWVEIISPLIEGTTSLPVQRVERMFKKWMGE